MNGTSMLVLVARKHGKMTDSLTTSALSPWTARGEFESPRSMFGGSEASATLFELAITMVCPKTVFEGVNYHFELGVL